jgi:hypothetical protein
MTRQKLVEQQAQRVYVAQESDGQPLHLFRRGVLDRHQPHGCGRFRRGVGAEVGIKQLCYAEVEELGDAVVRDKDIRRLDVAVNDLLAMSVVNRLADLAEETQPLAHRQPVQVAVGV